MNMRIFRDLSIRNKITLILLGIVAIVLFAVSVANVINEVQSTRSRLAARFSMLAKVVASHSGTALSIADIDRSAAQQIVSELAFEPAIQFAALFNAEGAEVVRYPAASREQLAPPQALGTTFTSDGFLNVVEEIKLNDGAVIGKIYL